MAKKINEFCISCGGCVAVCPYEAIVDKDGKYVIVRNLCKDDDNCGRKCVTNCPVGAIKDSGFFWR